MVATNEPALVGRKPEIISDNIGGGKEKEGVRKGEGETRDGREEVTREGGRERKKEKNFKKRNFAGLFFFKGFTRKERVDFPT